MKLTLQMELSYAGNKKFKEKQWKLWFSEKSRTFLLQYPMKSTGHILSYLLRLTLKLNEQKRCKGRFILLYYVQNTRHTSVYYYQIWKVICVYACVEVLFLSLMATTKAKKLKLTFSYNYSIFKI